MHETAKKKKAFKI